jgi:hypothetical protein
MSERYAAGFERGDINEFDWAVLVCFGLTLARIGSGNRRVVMLPRRQTVLRTLPD